MVKSRFVILTLSVAKGKNPQFIEKCLEFMDFSPTL